MCIFFSRFEDFSRDFISFRCFVVFYLFDGFFYFIKSWRDFEIVIDWELWDGVENIFIDKIIFIEDFEMFFLMCVDIFFFIE